MLNVEDEKNPLYELALTNCEEERTFDNLLKRWFHWFHNVEADYGKENYHLFFEKYG